MRALAIAVTLACACAKPAPSSPHASAPIAPPPAPPPAPPAATCESAIASSAALTLAATNEAEREDMRVKLDAAKPKMIVACHEDQWSQQLLDCLDHARTDAETGPCTNLLTPAQQEGVTRRLTSQ